MQVRPWVLTPLHANAPFPWCMSRPVFNFKPQSVTGSSRLLSAIDRALARKPCLRSSAQMPCRAPSHWYEWLSSPTRPRRLNGDVGASCCKQPCLGLPRLCVLQVIPP